MNENLRKNAARLELEQAFSKMPTLSHIGMSLMEFAFELQGTDSLYKDYAGIFCMLLVSFSFPTGEEKIKMFVRNVDIQDEKVREFGFKWLPLTIEDGLAVCEISHHGQLGQAAKYIWIAKNKYMSTRQIPPDSIAGN
jgi:hypothetical protein